MLKDGEGFQWTCVGISCLGLHLALGCGVLQAERQRVPHLAMEPLLVVVGGLVSAGIGLVNFSGMTCQEH